MLVDVDSMWIGVNRCYQYVNRMFIDVDSMLIDVSRCW